MGMQGAQTKAFYLSANYMKDKHCNNSCDPKQAKAKDQLPLKKKNFQTYEKDNTNLKNCVYLEEFRMSTKQL